VKTRLNHRLRPLSAALVLAGLFAAPGSVIAQSTDWSAGGGGNWATGGNWTTGAPIAGTTARLTNANDQATLNGAGAAQALEVQGSGEVIVGAGGSLVITDIINLGTTTGPGAARLTIQGGGTVSAAHLFAGDAPRQGIVTVTDAGSSLTLAPIGVGQADRFEIGGNGAGELHIDAGANVTVNGTRTLHVGDTANGTLFIGNGAVAGTLTADSVILGTAGSSVQFNHTGTTTFSAAVSGNGSLTKTGAGTTILSGANTYTGGTMVSGGVLQGDTTSLQGNITNNAAVNFNQAANGVYTGAMGGTGSLTKTGAGTLELTGTNNYAGGTTVTAGTLQGDTTSLQGAITNNAAVNFNQAANGVYTGAMGGTGSLTKTGAGTLELTGTNNYAGGTTVTAGTLQGDTTSLQSAITNNAAVNFNQATNGVYTGAMGGTGSLTKTGAGTLELTGTNNYAGGTTVTAGTLQGDTTSLQGNITNNAAVNFNQAANGVYTGAMGGTGSLTKTGAGTLELTGTNSYTGGTTVNGGTLQGDTTSLQGDITNNAAVSFNQAAGGTYAGRISGTGSLAKLGAGTLLLTGAHSYSGGTTVTAGSLQGNSTSLQGNISNNAAVIFDQTANGTYAGAMSGTGSLAKTGAGNLVLSGASSYNGGTAVNAGTLSVNGSIANSAVTVNNGGTLGGGGTVGSTSITTGGVLAPGNSIGTLTVNGNVTFAAGSVYRVEVDPAGNSDRVNATGTAALNGGTVDVRAGAGSYSLSSRYTILNAAGGRTGAFSGATSNLAFLTPSLAYDANNVFLTLARNSVSYASVGITPNQIATGMALQNAVAGASGDMGTVLSAVDSLSAPQARAAFDAASGAGIVELRRAAAGFAANFGNQLQARLGAVQSRATGTLANEFGGRPLLLAANGTLPGLMAPDAKPDAGNGLWARGFGGYGNTDTDGNAAASRLRSSGLSVGFDAEVKEGLRLGAAVTGGTSRLSTDNNESGKTRGTAAAVYAGYATGAWNFSGSASASWGKNHMDRGIAFGTVNRVASGDFDSDTLSAYGGATYTIAMDGWTLRPLAGLSLSRTKSDAFTETGAGALNLQVAGQTVTSSKAMLGAKASIDAGRVRVEPRVVWAHEFGDLNTPMTAQFQGAASASPFQALGTALKRDTLIFGLGASGSISKDVDLFADVQAEFNAAQRNLAVLVGLRSRW
jgi:fibronectin-binding autotransporter adhesin